MGLNMSIHRLILDILTVEISTFLRSCNIKCLESHIELSDMSLFTSSSILQGVYNPYMAQHYLQMYGAPSADSSDVYSFGQSGHLPPGNHGYTMLRGYRMPGQHIMQLGGPNITGGTTAAVPTIQVPYPTSIFLTLSSKLTK